MGGWNHAKPISTMGFWTCLVVKCEAGRHRTRNSQQFSGLDGTLSWYQSIIASLPPHSLNSISQNMETSAVRINVLPSVVVATWISLLPITADAIPATAFVSYTVEGVGTSAVTAPDIDVEARYRGSLMNNVFTSDNLLFHSMSKAADGHISFITGEAELFLLTPELSRFNFLGEEYFCHRPSRCRLGFDDSIDLASEIRKSFSLSPSGVSISYVAIEFGERAGISYGTRPGRREFVHF